MLPPTLSDGVLSVTTSASLSLSTHHTLLIAQNSPQSLILTGLFILSPFPFTHLRAQLRVLVSDALIDNWIFELPLQNHPLVITTPFSVSARSTRTFCGFRPILDLAANDLPRVFHRRRYIQFQFLRNSANHSRCQSEFNGKFLVGDTRARQITVFSTSSAQSSAIALLD